MIAATGEYLLVKPVYETVSTGGIIIADKSQKQVSDFYGIVVSVGPLCPFKELKRDDKVLFTRNEGTPVEYGNSQLLALKPDWVLAIKED